MKIRVALKIGEEETKTDVIEIADHKLEGLSADEIEAAIEVQVREWVNRLLSVVWETEEEGEHGG